MKATEMLNKIKEVLGIELSAEKVELAKEKLDNGTVIEADKFEQGSEVFIVNEGEKIPLPVGDYLLENGDGLSVKEEGIIAEIGKAEESDEKEDEKPAEEDELNYVTKEELAKAIEEIKAYIVEQKSEDLNEEVKEEQQEELKEEVKEDQKEEVKEELSEDKKELSVVEEEKVEDVELKAEVVEPITHNPEAKNEVNVNLNNRPLTRLEKLREMIYNN